MRTLDKKNVVIYSLPAFAFAGLGLTFYTYLPKYFSDEVGISGYVLGIIILLTRIFDAVIDPWIGKKSDSTKSNLGRRKFWIILGIIPLCIMTLILTHLSQFQFGNPEIFLFLYSVLFFFAFSLVSVPYESLGPELSDDYHGKTKIFTTRTMFFTLGTIVAGTLPIIIGGDADTKSISILGLIWAFFLLATTLPMIFLLKEPQQILNEAKTSITLSVFKNKKFVSLITAQAISGFGAALPAQLILFYGARVIGEDVASTALGIYLTLGLLFTPLWNSISRKLGKAEGWILALSINTGVFIGVFFLGQGDGNLFLILSAVSAIGLGGTLSLPYSIQADIVEDDFAYSGRRREGEFLGIWSITNKLSAALGAGIAFPVLQYFGYVSYGPLQFSTLFALSFLYAGVTCFANILSIFWILRLREKI